MEHTPTPMIQKLPQRRPRSPLARRRAERELFFWTAYRAIWLALAVAVVVFLIAQMLHGHNPIKLLEVFRSWPPTY